MAFRKEKSQNDIYQKYINKFDVVFLSESWNYETYNKLQHPVRYFYVNICRKRKNKAGRTSGGILVYYRNELSNSLSVLFINFVKILSGVN